MPLRAPWLSAALLLLLALLLGAAPRAAAQCSCADGTGVCGTNGCALPEGSSSCPWDCSSTSSSSSWSMINGVYTSTSSCTCRNCNPHVPGPGVCTRTCADSNGDGTADDAHDCSSHANDLDASPAGVSCAADPCTDAECCTVVPPPRTCADTNADASADDPHDCSAHANDLDASPAGISCAADPCTDAECCTNKVDICGASGPSGATGTIHDDFTGVVDCTSSGSPCRNGGAGAAANGYGDNLDCSKTITAPVGKVVSLTFSYIALETHPTDCGSSGCDTVTLYDGPDTSSQVIGVFGGTDEPAAQLSTGTTMTVRFQSDNGNCEEPRPPTHRLTCGRWLSSL